MPTISDIATALSALRLNLRRGDMFSARDVSHEMGAADDATALEVARMLATISHVEAKTIGADAHPDGLWGFL